MYGVLGSSRRHWLLSNRKASDCSVMPPQELQFVVGDRALGVQYASRRSGDFECTIDGGPPMMARVVAVDDARITAEIDGIRSSFDVVCSGRTWWVQSRSGLVELVEQPRFPEVGGGDVVGGQLAPMPGSIRAVAVAVGDSVVRGQTLVVMEAMKMEHTITAPGDAVVTDIRCGVGDQVDNGQVLVVLEPIE